MRLGRPSIAIDVDQVLVEWLRAFAEWMVEIGNTMTCRHEDVEWAHFWDAFVGEDKESIYRWVRAFNMTERFSRLPFIPGALEGVNALRRELSSNIRLVAVTSAGSDPATFELRSKNLEPFGLDEIHVVPLRAEKTAVLKAVNALVLVDDLPKYCAQADAAGIVSILFDAPHNRQITHPRRACGWSDVPDLVAHAIAIRAAA